MRTLVNSFFLASLVFLSACTKTDLDAVDYISFVEDEKNDLAKTKEIEGLTFQLQYCPTEYLLLKELKTDVIAPELMAKRKTENDSMLFFKLRIKTKDNSDVLKYKAPSEEDYYSRIQYLSFGFEEDVAIVSGTDTLFPAVFHFERTYGVAPFADFMLAFNMKPKAGEDFQVLIDDKIFNTGLLKYTYSNKEIQNIPQLKTN